MNYCVTPGCPNPQNPEKARFCLSCGSSLLLKERYRPINPIGRGGFGRTFLAVDEDIPSQPRCVVKQLYLESQNTLIVNKAVELFHQEAERLDELGQHPQIPALLAHFEQQKQLYLVQEFIAGQTLEQELQQQGVFNETKIWELLRDLLPVLKFVHSRHVIHRDIKPANIIRHTPKRSPPNPSGDPLREQAFPGGSPFPGGSLGTREGGKLVLIDFGVAKLIAGTALLHTGTKVGSPEYMAPEQTKGKALSASDLYSLGVTCIYLLTGVSPFDLFDIHNDRWMWEDYLPKDTKVSDRLSRILNKLVQNAVSQRYKSVDEVLRVVTPPTPAAFTPEPSPPSVLPQFLANLWRQYTAQPTADSLISEVGVNYTKLQQLLAAGLWQQADLETWAVLCQAVGKLSGSYLHSGDIDKLPCEDLRTIDQLWVKYSNGRFGFSVQKHIYQEVDGEYHLFCDRVGWRTYNSYFPDSGLYFSHRAPLGHLPSRQWAGGYKWWRLALHLAARLEQCAIANC